MKVYVSFSDEKVDLKIIRLFYLDIQNSSVSIEQTEPEILTKIGSTSPPITRPWSPLTLSSTVHKVQGLNLEQSVIDFDLWK